MSDTEQNEVPTPLQPASQSSASDAKIKKPKSPGRVAPGKKLAEMNRKNKAKKQKPQIVEEGWDINPGYVIGGLGLAIAAGSLYLQWKSSHAKLAKPAVHETPAKEPMPAPKPKSRIPEME